MKQRIKRTKKLITVLMSFVVTLVIVISAVFSSQLFTVNAYSQSDLVSAEKAESLARKEYEIAKAEADRFESIKQDLYTEEQEELLSDTALEIKNKMKSELTKIADSAINDIADVCANGAYSDTQKQEKTESILDRASSNISDLIDDLENLARTRYDEYIEVFADSGIDYSYVWDTLYTQIAENPGLIDFMLWDLFLDIEKNNLIEENRTAIHNAINKESTNIQNTITYEVPGWIAFCIDLEIENVMGDSEENWQSALQTLVEIRQDICNYDYSVTPEAVDYTKNTNKAVVFTINGDFDAVRKIEHFDMQADAVWNEEYQAEVIYGERIISGEDYVLQEGENNTIIVIINNTFLNKQSQGDHIFRLYYITENDDEYVSFAVSALPQGWTAEESYDDGQDWESLPVLLESELRNEEYVSDTDADVTEESSDSSTPAFVWIIILVSVFALIVVSIVFLVIFFKKKNILLKNKNESAIIKEEGSAKTKTKHKHSTKKNLLSLFLVLGVLIVSFSGLMVNAAVNEETSVANIRYTIPGIGKEPDIIKECPMVGDTVTLSGWGRTYDFDVLGWECDDPDAPDAPEDPWEETTIVGKGVSVAKGEEGKATFTTTNNYKGTTIDAGTITIKSPGGTYSFTVKQNVRVYDIKYNANGGVGAPASQTKKHLASVKLSSVKPTRDGYTFIGWATSASSKKTSYKPGKIYKNNQSVTLYALWKPNIVSITWDANGGSTAWSWAWKTVGTKIGTLPTTKRSNCDFVGWYVGTDGSGRKITSTTTVPVRNTTYYAKWKVKKVESTLTSNFSATPKTLEFTYNSTKKQSVTVKGYSGSSTKINYWKKLSVSKPNWVSVSKDSKGKLSISIKENKNTQGRSGVVILKSHSGDLCKITVSQSGKPISVSSVSLDRDKVSIDIGETVLLRQNVIPKDAANRAVKWTTSDAKIARVSADGIVRGVTQGTVTITVKTVDGGKTAKCKVTVNPPSITVVPGHVKLYVGESTKLDVEFTPSSYKDDNITWSRSFAFFHAAKVDSDGTVTAIRPGKTVVTARTSDGRKSTCTVEVIEKIKATSIKISPTAHTLFEGETVQLSYSIKPTDAIDKNLTWSSSDSRIATVDSNGKVTGVKGGTSDEPRTAIITATAQDGSGKKATCKVAVLASSNIELSKDRTKIKDINYGEGINVNGIIQSTHDIKSVTVGFISVADDTGEQIPYSSQSYDVNNTRFDLSKINKDVSFSNLPRGYYRFYIEAIDIYGYQKTLQDNFFYVKQVIVYAREKSVNEKSIKVEINDQTKPEWEFYGSIDPTKDPNNDGCGAAYIVAGIYWITKCSSDYNGHGAPAYAIHYAGNDINNSSEPIPCTRSPYPKNGCKVHGRSTYTYARVHQAPLNAKGNWSTGCITVQGPSKNGEEEMNYFAELVGDYAILIVER